MIATSGLLLLLLGTSVLTPSPAASPASRRPEPRARATFRYRPEVDAKYVYQTSSTMDGSVNVSVGTEGTPEAIPMKLRIEMEMELRCTSTDAKRTRFEQTIRWIKLDGEHPGVTYSYDSRRAETSDQDYLRPFFDALGRLTQKKLQVEVPQLGGAVYTRPSRELLAGISGPIGFEQLETLVSSVFPALPEVAEQSKGGSWSTSEDVDVPAIGSVSLETTYRVESEDAGTAKLKIEVTPKFKASQQVPQNAIEVKDSSGASAFDLSDGMLRTHSSLFRVKLDLSTDDYSLEGDVSLGSTVTRV